jgi:hypothetical protein
VHTHMRARGSSHRNAHNQQKKELVQHAGDGARSALVQ